MPPEHTQGTDAGARVTSSRDALGLLLVISVAQHRAQALPDNRRLGAARPHKVPDAYVLPIEQLTEALQAMAASAST